MKGKRFIAVFRNGDDGQLEKRVLNGRGEKKQFLNSVEKKEVKVLEVSRIRRPLSTLTT